MSNSLEPQNLGTFGTEVVMGRDVPIPACRQVLLLTIWPTENKKKNEVSCQTEVSNKNPDLQLLL